MKVITASERTFERGRGCWNCKSFENGKLARQHWRACRAADEAHVVAKAGGNVILSRLGDMENPQAQEIDARFQMMDRMVINGSVGMCMKGKTPGTFVHHQYLCEGWDGRDGHSVATSGRPLDKLPDELRDIADSRTHAPISTKRDNE